MMKIFPYIFVLIVLFTIFSCEKRSEFPEDYEIIELKFPEKSEIRDIVLMNDSVIFLCGGEKYNHGYIYKSSDSGSTWHISMSDDNFSVNALCYCQNQHIFAAGDSMKIWRSIDFGITCQAIFAWNNDEILAVGGEYYQKGLTSKSETGSWSWKQTSWDNAWFDMEVVDTNKVIISGYGKVLISNNRGKDFIDSELYGDVFVSVITDNENNTYVLGQSGALYVLNGNRFEKHQKISGLINDIALNNNTGFAVGNSGSIYQIDEFTGKWTNLVEFTTHDFSIIQNVGTDFLLGTVEGDLFLIRQF